MKILPLLAHQMNVLKPEGAYAVLSKATEMEKKGHDIVHFEIGQPDFPTPTHIVETAVESLKQGKTKYNPPLGIPELRETIANKVSKIHNISISPKQVAVTPSGKTAIFTAMTAVLEKGDEVMYPDPGFPTYGTLVDFLGCVRKPVPMLEEKGFSFDIKILKKNFSKKTKLIILNSPSNPTGGIIPRKDLEEVANLVKGTKCWVMTDDMYQQIIYDKNSLETFYSLRGILDRTLLVNGFSKTYAMTGWRIGYICAPERIMSKIEYLLTHVVGCTATFTQYAAISALNGPQKEVGEMVREFKKRRDFVVKRLNTINGISCITPAGAFYAFPNIKKFKKSSSWLANYLLEKGGVALLAGSDFGEYGEGYLRISYATGMDKLKEGLERVEKALKKI